MCLLVEFRVKCDAKVLIGLNIGDCVGSGVAVWEFSGDDEQCGALCSIWLREVHNG